MASVKVILLKELNLGKELPKNINFAYLPSLGRVRLRISSKGINESKFIKD